MFNYVLDITYYARGIVLAAILEFFRNLVPRLYLPVTVTAIVGTAL